MYGSIDFESDRQLSNQEVRELFFDIRIKKIAENGVKTLFDHFKEFEGVDTAQERRNYNAGVSNLIDHLLHGGESGIGAVRLVQQVLLELRDRTTEDLYIVDELIIANETMGPRYLAWMVDGGELNYD